MAFKIEKYARQAVEHERVGDYDPVAPVGVMQDISELAALHRQTWKQRQRTLVENGVPIMLEGVYAGLNAYPPGGQVAVASISGEVGVPPTSWCPIPANSILAPEAFRVAITATLVTGATPASWTINPRIGTSSSGAALGASSAIALTASITSNYYILGDITMRTATPGATGATAIGFFHLVGKLATAGNGVVDQNILFGHTSASFQNDSVSQALWMGAAHTVTTITHNVQQVHWMSWN